MFFGLFFILKSGEGAALQMCVVEGKILCLQQIAATGEFKTTLTALGFYNSVSF